jgi:hypothetical protein
VSNIDSKIGVWRATSIQKIRHLDSIVAGALLVADFIDSIDPKAEITIYSHEPRESLLVCRKRHYAWFRKAVGSSA